MLCKYTKSANVSYETNVSLNNRILTLNLFSLRKKEIKCLISVFSKSKLFWVILISRISSNLNFNSSALTSLQNIHRNIDLLYNAYKMTCIQNDSNKFGQTLIGDREGAEQTLFIQHTRTDCTFLAVQIHFDLCTKFPGFFYGSLSNKR